MIKHPAVPYIAPFAAFLLFLAARPYLPLEYPFRVLTVGAVIIFVSRRVVTLRVAKPLLSVLAGIAVFAVWIAPDLIWPGYRGHWLFSNSLTGAAQTSLPAAARTSLVFLLFRVAGTVVIVPIAEELFWRAWLMRFLISPKFETVRLGAYSAFSFWVTAALFATEHGPYWEVGLLAGIAYNLLMIRTHSLGDCILAHAVTNACLAAYVLGTASWQYWL